MAEKKKREFILTNIGYAIDSHRAASSSYLSQFSTPKNLLLKYHNPNDYCEMKWSVFCVTSTFLERDQKNM